MNIKFWIAYLLNQKHGVYVPPSGSFMLNEDGGFMLNEDGSKMLLET